MNEGDAQRSMQEQHRAPVLHMERQHLRERHLARATTASATCGVVLQVRRQRKAPLLKLAIEYNLLRVPAARGPQCVDCLHNVTKDTR